jgi:glucoamylase
MVHRAACYLVQNGPVTPQDRWEEDPGYSPFTLSVEIAALLAAADLADLNGEPVAATYLREKADTWNANVERWTYVTGTDLAKQVGVEGYYVRIAPLEVSDAPSPLYGFVPIKNRPLGKNVLPATHIISPDALALVRFGLRAPDDPRIVNTVNVIDALLKVETPYGPAWHRYNDDGYGEHSDGAPFDGAGVGRAWPLLTGERAHYELAAGRRDVAEKLIKTFEAFANNGGMIPEQVWDSTDIPERRLFFGKHSGSAMPLVWAHAEYVKLCRSLHEGYVFDMPRQTVERYVVKKTDSPHAIWNFGDRCRSMLIGKILRLELFSPAMVHWSSDGWSTFQDIEARDTHVGIFVADLPTDRFPAGTIVHFTFYWPEETRWEKVDYSVIVE